jgi:hypothetical protein
MTPLQFAGIVLALCVASWSTLSTHSDATSAPQVQRPFVEASHKWDINILPSENATGHLVFQSVSSLLQHWPNARYRNGSYSNLYIQPIQLTDCKFRTHNRCWYCSPWNTSLSWPFGFKVPSRRRMDCDGPGTLVLVLYTAMLASYSRHHPATQCAIL